jgi:tRNA modification GTPase
MDLQDNIAALATGEQNAPLGIIRISGRKLLSEPLPFLRPLNKKIRKIDKTLHKKVFLSHLVDGDKICDTSIVTVFASPESYTGEDVIEISLHGNQILLKDCIKILLKYDIRPAQPGEFTKRAFLNNKLDLSQAEAIDNLIKAQNRFTLETSRRNMHGYISTTTSMLRSFLMNLRADLEAELDFTDQDLEITPSENLIQQASVISEKIQTLLRQAKIGEKISGGIWGVICGKPNVGKSTLFNLLLGYKRAIVSAEPGTTRDFLREELEIDGNQLCIYDTAGIRDDKQNENNISTIEKEGINKSKRLRDDANIQINILDISINLEMTDDLNDLNINADKMISVDQLKNRLINPKAQTNTDSSEILNNVNLIILNKYDIRHEQFLKKYKYIESYKLYSLDKFSYLILLSLIQEDQARKTIIGSLEYIFKRHFNRQDGILLSERIQYNLTKSISEMNQVLMMLKNGESFEYISIHLNTIMEEIGKICGNIDTEEILGRIFSRFCIGK